MQLVIYSVFALFVYSCFQYGKIFYFLTEWVVKKESKRLGVNFSLPEGSYSQRSEHFDNFIDFLAERSFLIRLYNCSLCFTTWVVLVICFVTGGNLLEYLAVNYFINFVHNRI